MNPLTDAFLIEYARTHGLTVTEATQVFVEVTLMEYQGNNPEFIQRVDRYVEVVKLSRPGTEKPEEPKSRW